MIQGIVNADYEAVITLALHGPAGQARDIEVVIDTDYNGFLSLPPTLAAELEFPVVGPSQATLANGVEEAFNRTRRHCRPWSASSCRGGDAA